MAIGLSTKFDDIVSKCQKLKTELKDNWYDDTTSPATWTNTDAKDTWENLDYIETDIDGSPSFKSEAIGYINSYEGELDERHSIRLATLKLGICYPSDFWDKFVGAYEKIRDGSIYDDVLYSGSPLGKLNEIDALDLSVESNLTEAKSLSQDAVNFHDDHKTYIRDWDDVHQTGKGNEDTFIQKFSSINSILGSDQGSPNPSKEIYTIAEKTDTVDAVESIETKLENDTIDQSEVADEIANEVNDRFLNNCNTIENKVNNL